MGERARLSSENAVAAARAAVKSGELSPARLDEIFRAARDSTILAAIEELPARALTSKQFEMLEVLQAAEFDVAAPGLYRARVGDTGAWFLLQVFPHGGFVVHRAVCSGVPTRH
jgi:hypothetical protein